MRKIILIGVVALILACSTSGPKKVVLDSEGDKPAWAEGTRVIWEKEDKVFLKSKYTIKGSERPNACFALAKMDSKEALISEVQNEVKGLVTETTQSISENAEILLSKSRASEFTG